MVLKGAVRFAFKFPPYGLDGEVCKTGQHRLEGRTAHSVNMGGASASQASDASGEHRDTETDSTWSSWSSSPAGDYDKYPCSRGSRTEDGGRALEEVD
ncbi:hypothetical protein MG293_015701 [Ovis ammon polii]|uniref:Uncharacterized protein n=1 Tax=Ovis ammon polii TaxID=230172 RepID=A0AAD4TXZ2_OVIAM|nr:hypothetical protein MG293_015701 [Ovis ammon polii]KAI4558306.1 hypothetical protein MJT46_012948 [Ovis ammon polii x Ovis aries]